MSKRKKPGISFRRPLRYKLKHLWYRIKRPFKVQVWVFDHAEIRVRSFPPLFEYRWVKSVQDMINETAERGGGLVNLMEAHYITGKSTFKPPSGAILKGKSDYLTSFRVEDDIA